MAGAIEITPRGPFSLTESIAFAEDFDPILVTDEPGAFGCALCDDDGAPAAFLARQEGDVVSVEHDGALPDGRMRAHVERILSLDVDGSGLGEVAKRDPVVASLLEEFPGRRPVCFPTPFEAAAWSVLSQRTSRRQAAVAKRTLTEALGEQVGVGGAVAVAFPSPAVVAGASELPGVSGAQRLSRLRGVAEAAADGAFDAELLRGFATPDEAVEHLTQIHGVGPFSALLILIRGAGHPDVAPPTTIPPARRALAGPYGLDPNDIDAAKGAELAEAWRPYRSWVFFLLRNREAAG